MQYIVTLSKRDEWELDEFVAKQQMAHRAAECEFPGYSVEISLYPAVGYQIFARVGSVVYELEEAKVKVIQDL